MSLLDWCQWLQDTPAGTSIRESDLIFPIIETALVIGLAATPPVRTIGNCIESSSEVRL
jgi:hypothetical protein